MEEEKKAPECDSPEMVSDADNEAPQTGDTYTHAPRPEPKPPEVIEEDASAWVDVDHICPFCGTAITPANILFVEENGITEPDARRADRMRRFHLPLPENEELGGVRFSGLYYLPKRDAVMSFDRAGYPLTMKIDGSMSGLTADELENVNTKHPEAWRANLSESTDVRHFQDVLKQRACPGCHFRLPERFG